ncbi:MAG: tetratricopeptide repeat protein [Bryobacteraceae bacterium]|nr:tetratricopeptide repeat protein [Bryobacteraceae bacterium]
MALLLMLQSAPLAEARQAMARGDYAAARSAINRALAASAADPAARFLSGFLFYLENELPRAITELQLAAKLNPKDSRARLYLALSLESAGRMMEAETEYKAAVSLADSDPKGDPETHLAYARYEMVTGDLDGAAELIGRALKIAPKSRDAHFEHARLLLRLDKPQEAAEAAATALECAPGGIPEAQVRYVLSRARSLAADSSNKR